MSFARQPTRKQLLESAQALCAAFAAKADVGTLLAHFSSTHQISALEHGLPVLAPFLGRPFAGRAGPASVPAYFELLQQHLTYEDMSFGPYVVDADASRISVKGSAKFTWAEGAGTGQAWEECFVYILDFDQDAKVTDYQVWADSGAAYLARTGVLAQLTAIGQKVRGGVGGCARGQNAQAPRGRITQRINQGTIRAIPRRLLMREWEVTRGKEGGRASMDGKRVSEECSLYVFPMYWPGLGFNGSCMSQTLWARVAPRSDGWRSSQQLNDFDVS